MPPIPKHPSRTELVVAYIREQITTGAWPPGSRLPSRRRLMAELDVSITTVRKAQEILKRSGELTSRAGVAWFVAGQPEENPPEG